VSSPLAGRLVRVVLRPGDRVEASKTLLAAIEPVDPALLDVRARSQALARVDGAEAAPQKGDLGGGTHEGPGLAGAQGHGSR